MGQESQYEINPRTYEWSIRVFSTLRRMLRVNIKMHHSKGQLEAGQIFLFNHFARFETFIPQYLIYEETGDYCRSIASYEFFENDDMMASYLRAVGAVPNHHPRLLFLLAAEILRGRKVVVFPEGGMVKDRRVVDHRGIYSIYSRTALERRKHHTGAAVLGLVLDAFKTAILDASMRGARDKVSEWADYLGIESAEALLVEAVKPTLIVPANITFYPLRVDENLLLKGVRAFSKGISPRSAEELLVEGNILLKDTDMDIRLGDAIRPNDHWRWWERVLFQRLFHHTDALEHLYDIRGTATRLNERMFRWAIRRKTHRVRDLYMAGMYQAVTVNLSHLTATLIMRQIEQGITEIETGQFFTALYLAIKALQSNSKIHLHRSLRNPRSYRGVLAGTAPGITQLLETARETGLIELDERSLLLLPKLLAESDFDQVRLENILMVYANEAKPIRAVIQAIDAALREAPGIGAERLAEAWFDDELRDHLWARQAFAKPRFEEINRLETATESGEPFLLRPKEPTELGVLLVHGLFASPAEMRGLAEHLEQASYTVLGVRLAGHASSPHDLAECHWEDWLDSVRRGYRILSRLCQSVIVVGFSTGGILGLRCAAEAPEGLGGVVCINGPVKLRDRNMAFVPLVHTTNRLIRWTSGRAGVMAFRPNESEHPQVNYHTMPISALQELRGAIDDCLRHLPQVQCPSLLIQADADPVVDPKSAELLFREMIADDKDLEYVSSDRHGIVYENVDPTWELVTNFLKRLEEGRPLLPAPSAKKEGRV